jgi:hypothetical protein
LRYYPDIFLALSKIMNKLGQDKACFGRDLNRVPLEFKSEASALEPNCLVTYIYYTVLLKYIYTLKAQSNYLGGLPPSLLKAKAF